MQAGEDSAVSPFGGPHATDVGRYNAPPLLLFFAAFALGLTFNAAPGPVFAATLRYAAGGGFRPALAVQLGSLVGDGAWAVIGLAAVALAGRLDALRTPVAIAGAAYLLWLAWDAWRAGGRVGHATFPSPRDRDAMRSGILLSLTNPQNVGYWAALGTSLAAFGVAAPGWRDYSVFYAGFMLSSVVWSFLFAGIVHWLLGGRRAGWARTTYRLSAVLFAALAVLSLRAL